jgi:hypothetical protein
MIRKHSQVVTVKKYKRIEDTKSGKHVILRRKKRGTGIRIK